VWAISPNHGIIFDDTWKIVNDLEILIKRLKAKQAKVSMVVCFCVGEREIENRIQERS
jgi:hypothetical protein